MLSLLFLVPVVLVGPAAEAPPPTETELVALHDALRSPSPEQRLEAARAIAKLPPSGLSLYEQRLRRSRDVPADTFRRVVMETWAQVPDPDYARTGNLWVTKPEPPWKPQPPKKGQPRAKRPPPHDPEKVEWLTALAALDVDGNEALKAVSDRASLAEARADAIEAVALMEAIAAAGRAGDPSALDPLFDFAFDLDGVFRDECGRAIRSMESQAIPGLIRRMRMSATKTLKGMQLFRMKRYASYQLDRMDRAQPRKAIATAPDDRIRAAIVHAYGEVRALDAVEAILDQVDANGFRVREEARWAWLRYVTGPPPPEAPKRKRNLGGGHTESVEKEDYLNYREMAVLALNKALAAIHEGEPCASCAKLDEGGKPLGKVDAKKMTDELWAFYDRRRAVEWDAQWAEAVRRREAGDLEGAIRGFSYILAHDPSYDRRPEMAATYYALGERLLGGRTAAERSRASDLLRAAIALDPASPRATWAAARVLWLDAMARFDAGVVDPEPFRRAAALDPGFVDASRMAERLRPDGDRSDLVRRSAQAAMALAALCAVLTVALGISRRRSTG